MKWNRDIPQLGYHWAKAVDEKGRLGYAQIVLVSYEGQGNYLYVQVIGTDNVFGPEQFVWWDEFFMPPPFLTMDSLALGESNNL